MTAKSRKFFEVLKIKTRLSSVGAQDKPDKEISKSAQDLSAGFSEKLQSLRDNYSASTRKVDIDLETRCLTSDEVDTLDNIDLEFTNQRTYTEGEIPLDNIEIVNTQSVLHDELRVVVEYAPLTTTKFFEVDATKDRTLLLMNSNHVFAKRMLNDISVEKREVMEVCLAAWAKMELECTNDKRRAQLQLARSDWGQVLDDYLDNTER